MDACRSRIFSVKILASSAVLCACFWFSFGAYCEGTVRVDGLQVPGSPFEVEVSAGPPTGANATASGSALALATAGENASFVIQVPRPIHPRCARSRALESCRISRKNDRSEAQQEEEKHIQATEERLKFPPLLLLGNFSCLPASRTPSPSK